MPTRVKVRKWGNKMAVVIPRNFAKRRAIQLGTTIDMDSIGIPKSGIKRLKLAELMAKFEPKHRHGEWKLGEPVGCEIW